MEDERDTALAWVQRWHDADPSRRRMLDGDDVLGVRVLGPVQIRLSSLLEERHYRFGPHWPAPEGEARASRPSDPWSVEAPAPPDVDALLDELPPGETVERDAPAGEIVETCPRCDGEERHRCELCEGSGWRDIDECELCLGRGQRRCELCGAQGACRTRVTLVRRFTRRDDTRLHEDDAQEVGPHALLHLLEHPTPSEVLHEQRAPRIGRYAGKGAGGGYREAASRLAGRVDGLLAAVSDEGEGRVVQQRLTLTRIPVYALELARGRTLQVYGDPPEVSPARLLRARWLALLPVVLTLLVILGGALFFFAMVGVSNDG